MLDPFEVDKCCSIEQVRTAGVLLEEVGMLAIEKLVEDSCFMSPIDSTNKHMPFSNATDVSFLAGATLVLLAIVLFEFCLSTEWGFLLCE